MAYDRLAESVALIESRHLAPVRRLSRRRRFAAMAVDVAGDVAATMFARRGVACIWKETHVLAHRDRGWVWVGSGGASSREDLLADRLEVLSGYLTLGRDSVNGAVPRAIVVNGSGGALDHCEGANWQPGSGRWISYADVRVSARVTSVQISERRLPVPWHGHVLLVWSEREPPQVVAYDDGGGALGEVLLP